MEVENHGLQGITDANLFVMRWRYVSNTARARLSRFSGDGQACVAPKSSFIVLRLTLITKEVKPPRLSEVNRA
jgi:hypothetical protein